MHRGLLLDRGKRIANLRFLGVRDEPGGLGIAAAAARAAFARAPAGTHSQQPRSACTGGQGTLP